MSKTQLTENELDKKNSSNPEEELKSEKDILKKPEDNTRYGDWVKNGQAIDF